MSGDASEIYRRAILEQVPRVLGMIDREPLSPTAGCCDRTYWSWKFVDFPRSRFQEALCVLGFLWAREFAGNRLHGNPRLKEWICSGLRFWTTIQHKDGSFDEAYPYERSLAATAFTTFYTAEALAFLGDAAPADVRDAVRAAVARAGGWLVANDETHGFLSNHLAAAAAALRHAHRITGETAFRDRSRYFVSRILERQSREGWYEEYGGADPGYQTHGSFYLARHWQLGRDTDLLDSLRRANFFLATFVHPDGSLGGEYASRNTKTYYPAAYEMLAGEDGAAAWIAATLRRSVGGSAAAGLRGIDAYNFFPFLNNLVFAYLAASEPRTAVEPEGPPDHPGIAWFPEAGLARVRTARYDAYVATSKGGVIKVFDRRRRSLAYSDCGYIGRLRGGRLFSTQQQNGSRAVHADAERIELAGSLYEVSRPTMRPWRFTLFRLATLTVGRMPGPARWIKNLLVRVLIQRRRRMRVEFERSITFAESSLSIVDSLKGRDLQRAASLRRDGVFTTIHMGSSRYFVDNELEETAAIEGDTGAVLDPARVAGGGELRRTIRLE